MMLHRYYICTHVHCKYMYMVHASAHCKLVHCYSVLTCLSPVSTHTFIPAILRLSIVSGTPSCSLSSIPVVPDEIWGGGKGGEERVKKREYGGPKRE